MHAKKFVSLVTMLGAFVASYRIGEAQNPGPDSSIALGVINPSGLASKAIQCKALPAGIFGVSETHLTTPGVHRFRQELRGVQSHFSFCPGAPAPFKRSGLGCIGGKNVGVGFLSTEPSRALECEWSNEKFASSRIQAASFFLGSTWVKGGIVYGYANLFANTDVRSNTNSLLTEVISQLQPEQPGLKFVGGDFNQLPRVLDAVCDLESKGWIDIQDLAWQRWQIQPSDTCKRCTRKDFLYLSPALQELVLSVHNNYDLFPDHSTLFAKIRKPSSDPCTFTWFKPQPIDCGVTSLPDECVIKSKSVQETTTHDYAALCKSFEMSADCFLRSQQKPGLIKSQFGRASTLDRIAKGQSVAPPRPSRKGEPSTIECKTLQHKRWFVQFRRLLNYQRVAFSTQVSISVREHKISLWHAILKAPGFGKNFQLWWPTRATRSLRGPLMIPTHPPEGHIAKEIFDAFELEFKHLEKIIKDSRKQQLDARYSNDTNAVYRDVRKPSPMPVEVLIATSKSTVVSIVDDFRVTIEGETPIDVARVVDLPIGKQWVNIESDNVIVFPQPHQLAVGDTIVQTDHIGRVAAIHKAFEDTWEKRWSKHKEVSQDHWKIVHDFIDQAIPQGKMDPIPLTPERLHRVASTKKSRSATGLDGVSRSDVVLMNHYHKQWMCDIFKHAEHTGQWPKQLVEGAIYTMAKHDQAQGTNDYRPITVLPVPYRCWASYKARHLLSYLNKIVPAGLKGNMPGVSSTSVWWQLQSRIEDAHYTGLHMTGCVTDLVKAFNLLPRAPIFHAARRLGIDEETLRAWEGAVQQVQRRFFIRQQPSAGVPSCTGFPEGDPLSVVAMAIANIVVHELMSFKHPDVEMQSYVDNIELVGGDAQSITNAFRSLQDFCWLLDVEVDRQKTYVWSTDPGSRVDLRQGELTLETSARDLGGHMQYTACKSNASVRKKCEELSQLWPYLRRSGAPKEHKVRTLKTVAWPRALHGASTVNLNKNTFDSMRAGAMKALSLDKLGSNSQIHWSLIENPLCDPEFYALWSSCLALRRHHLETVTARAFDFASEVPKSKRKPGPAGLLLSKLEQMGWQHVRGFLFLDSYRNPIHLLETPIQELKQRVRQEWRQYVGSLWSSRFGFEGLQCVDAQLSQVSSAEHNRDEVGALITLQQGTFCTHDQLCGAKQVDSKDCRFCGSPDSLEHRHWHCPSTSFSRQLMDETSRIVGPSLPPCTRDRGWMVEVASVRQYKQTLSKIPDTIDDHQPLPVSHYSSDWIDLFTDGTALETGSPMTRLVAWGVVIAPTSVDGHSQPISYGGVPGYWQTVARAELSAFISAVSFAYHNQKSVRIWCDNQLVVDRARLLLKHRFIITPLTTDHDLWNRLAELFRVMTKEIVIVKVGSHQDETVADLWQAWAFRHNESADKLAEFALTMLPQEVIESQRKASRDVQFQTSLKKQLHAHFARVAMMSIQNPDAKLTKEPLQSIPEDCITIDFAFVADNAFSKAPENLKFEGWLKCLQWLREISDASSQGTVALVSWYELLWSLQLHVGKRGVHSVSAHNHWALDKELDEYDCAKNAHQLSKWITHIIRLSFEDWKPSHARPSNCLFQNWMMCVAFRWNPSSRERLTSWMNNIRNGKHFHKIKNDIASMPVAFTKSTPVVPASKWGLHRFGFTATS